MEEKIIFLQSLQGIKTIIRDKHWIVGGDFNIITSLDKRRWGIGSLEVES
jgi:hypothetical protein